MVQLIATHKEVGLYGQWYIYYVFIQQGKHALCYLTLRTKTNYYNSHNTCTYLHYTAVQLRLCPMQRII